MRAIATKQLANDSAKEKKNGDRVRSPRHVSPLSTGMPLLQRQCACGGSCPRCQEKLGIQTKLKISEPGDKYEQEADRIADEVMRMPEPSVQRQVEPEEEEEMVQRKAISQQETSEAPSIVHEVLNSSGQPLDAETRTFMESRFGVDLNLIQVHTDDTAARSAQVIHASAYTTGNHIIFGAGQYTPQTDNGRRLIAHELVHTLQPSQDSIPVIQRQIKIPIFDEFDPCIQVEDQQLCGSDAKKACETIPAIPGCDAVCRVLGCKKPDKPDFSCPPGFQPGRTTNFKGQCCPQGIVAENATDCCPSSQIPVNAPFVRCCPPHTKPDAERRNCVTSTPPLPQPPPVLQPPVPPVPQPPVPPSPIPTPLPAATEIFFKLDRPLPGATGLAAFQASTTGEGQSNFSTLVAQLQSDQSLQVQLVGRASPEGTEQYNLDLGARRANLIAEELVRAGIASSRISNPPNDDLRSECQEVRSGIFTCGEAGASGERDRLVLVRVFQAPQSPNP